MSTLSTASEYINKINTLYPIAGEDNSTQGFRDNFKNIRLALSSTDEEVYSLKINSVTLNNPVNDFDNNIIKQAAFQDTSQIVYDASTTIQTSDVTVDYKNGHYQKFTVNEGLHVFTVNNWPDTGQAGSILLSISTSSLSTTTISFSALNVYNFGQNVFPVRLRGSNPHLFELRSDGTAGNLYVKEYIDRNEVVLPTVTTSTIWTISNTQTGLMVFLSGNNYNRPAYWNGTSWYVLSTGTVLTV